MKLFKKAKKGFTLVELVVVIAVIAILAAVSVGAYFGVTDTANKSAAEQEAKAFHTNLVLVANAPENSDVCVLNAKGLDIKGENDIEDVVSLVQAASGSDFTGYTITFVQDAENGSDDEYDYLSFGHTNGKTVTIDVVTGDIISTL